MYRAYDAYERSDRASDETCSDIMQDCSLTLAIRVFAESLTVHTHGLVEPQTGSRVLSVQASNFKSFKLHLKLHFVNMLTTNFIEKVRNTIERSYCETNMSAEEHHPLLPSDRIHFPYGTNAEHAVGSARRQTKRFLTSKTGK